MHITRVQRALSCIIEERVPGGRHAGPAALIGLRAAGSARDRRPTLLMKTQQRPTFKKQLRVCRTNSRPRRRRRRTAVVSDGTPASSLADPSVPADGDYAGGAGVLCRRKFDSSTRISMAACGVDSYIVAIDRFSWPKRALF